jgi:hypothetical protein
MLEATSCISGAELAAHPIVSLTYHLQTQLSCAGKCDVSSLFGSFWTISARIGAFAQYDFMYGLIYRIFLVFLGLFPVGFRLFG